MSVKKALKNGSELEVFEGPYDWSALVKVEVWTEIRRDRQKTALIYLPIPQARGLDWTVCVGLYLD